MAMGEYRGVNGVARKITKEYRGVSGVARQVVKAYRGVSNVARQYFSAIKTHLYNAGDLCTSVSGGWTSKTGDKVMDTDQTGWEGTPAMSKETDHLYIHMKDLDYEFDSEYNYIGCWHTSSAVALDEYDKVVLVCDIQAGSAYAAKSEMDSRDGVRVSISPNKYANDYVVRKGLTFESWNFNGEHTLEADVSTLTGDYYIIIDMRRSYQNLTEGDETLTLKIKEVYLR